MIVDRLNGIWTELKTENPNVFKEQENHSDYFELAFQMLPNFEKEQD